jgi:hypothetical protein
MSSTRVAIAFMMTVSIARAADHIPSEVRETVLQRVEQGDCVGLVIGVVDAQGTAYFSRGRLSKDGDRPVGEDTIFEIGSITKAFTAILLADMVERNLVVLDDPVQEYLPSSARMPSRGGKHITLGDLAPTARACRDCPMISNPRTWRILTRITLMNGYCSSSPGMTFPGTSAPDMNTRTSALDCSATRYPAARTHPSSSSSSIAYVNPWA